MGNHDTITSRGVLAESLCNATNGDQVWLQLSDEARAHWRRRADVVMAKLARLGHLVVHKDVIPDLSAFKANFGRDPEEGDPIFFDPDAETPQPIKP